MEPSVTRALTAPSASAHDHRVLNRMLDLSFMHAQVLANHKIKPTGPTSHNAGFNRGHGGFGDADFGQQPANVMAFAVGPTGNGAGLVTDLSFPQVVFGVVAR